MSQAAVEETVPSAIKPPDPKKQLSVRVRRSSHAKVALIVDIWREQLQASGDEEGAEGIDITYVVDLLLAKATDDELQQWGGFPDSEAKRLAVLKAVRAASKQ
jgi:hypothetical protein